MIYSLKNYQRDAVDELKSLFKLYFKSQNRKEIVFKAPTGSGKSVQQVINENSNDTLIIRMDGHLTCAINGLSYDIFDCTDYICTDYWVVDKARNYKEA